MTELYIPSFSSQHLGTKNSSIIVLANSNESSDVLQFVNVSPTLEDHVRTQINYAGNRKLLSSNAARNYLGGIYNFRLSDFETNPPSNYQCVTVITGSSLPLIIYSFNPEYRDIDTNPKRTENLQLLTFGFDPETPGFPFEVRYYGNGTLVKYEQALAKSFPFLGEIRVLSKRLNRATISELIKYKKSRAGKIAPELKVA
jgi:hypothetical protein